MKIFAIRDESAADQIDLAYLLYYEMEKRFYIELPENADRCFPWDVVRRMITTLCPLKKRSCPTTSGSVLLS